MKKLLGFFAALVLVSTNVHAGDLSFTQNETLSDIEADLWVPNGPGIVYLNPSNANVGIGTSSPAGKLDIVAFTPDAVSNGINLQLIQSDGTLAGTDATGLRLHLTGNDADADVFGISITTAATTNASTGTYEAGIKIDNQENTVGSMPDGIVIRSNGINGGITDAIDVSDANIGNAINIGANPIVTGNAAGSLGDAQTDSWTVITDGTGDSEVVLPSGSIGGAELTSPLNLSGLAKLAPLPTQAGGCVGASDEGKVYFHKDLHQLVVCGGLNGNYKWRNLNNIPLAAQYQ